ncbi:MAG TPA: glycosyltransferase family 4 protein [Ignavibacteriaceae bacterium]|nr:glycosyltransferase family 4 protein [Ignavibacteriaceae bacterium]
MILALLCSKFIKSKLAVLSDTWVERNKNISWFKICARKIAYKYFSDVFIGASIQTLNMYRSFNKNIKDEQLFLSALCADNEYFNKNLNGKNIKSKYDIMFSGRIVGIKNPLFFAEVAIKIKNKIGNCSVLIIGDGDEKLKNDMFNALKENGINYHYAGFIEHRDLPEYYAQSKVLLLPTSEDCWGVVINEAMVAGLPVITTKMTAAAGELVLDGINGFVLPLDSEQWAEKITGLLKNSVELKSFSKCAKEMVNGFNFQNAADGIISAIEYLKGK